MKKILFLLVFYLFIFNVYGQIDPNTLSINRCISLLNNPVPGEFQQVGKDIYYNKEDILLFVSDGQVIVSSLVNLFKTEHEAENYNSIFINYFNNSDWLFFKLSKMGANIYLKDKVYVIIEKPRKQKNGSFETMIGFSRNLNLDEM